MDKLTVGNIVSNGFKLGLKNLLSLVGAVVLWIFTIWIPYLNIGTTIGMIAIIVAISKGEVISPTEIFDAKYRRYIGEFFLLMALLYGGILVGYFFFIIPGLVISVAWGQALFLMIDKGLNPLEALKTSNDITYGKKWTIFGGMIIISILLFVIFLIMAGIGHLISDNLSIVFALIGLFIFYPVILGAQSYIYGTLIEELE